jgi:hypothetical protein
MTRYERKLFFEQLVAMRDVYQAEAHEPLDMTLADAMALAQRALLETVPAEAASTPSSTASATQDVEQDY